MARSDGRIAKLRAWFGGARAALRREEGQTLVEYALIAGFIGIASIPALILLAPGITPAFEAVKQLIEDHMVL
jgi:Flp pilus assembly pilin Flp